MQIKSFKVFLKDNEDKRLKILLDKIPASHKSILKDISIIKVLSPWRSKL